MKTWKRNLWRHTRDIVLITILGTAFALLFSNLDQLTWEHFLFDVLYSFLIGATLWKGNALTGYLIDKWVPKKDYPAVNLRVQILAMFLFSVGDIFLINYCWFSLYRGYDFIEFLTIRNGWVILLLQFIITVIIGLSLYVKGYFKFWKEALKNEGELKREKLQLQYEALKNQVNPHFLFNSLNTLSSLVYDDPAKADAFIKKLSEIYRYVLEQKDKELVNLDMEIKFLSNYVDLQKIRFGNNLNVNLKLVPMENKKVIPISLQMLIENAIKHNIISTGQPLTIDVFCENDSYVVVKNNLQKKTVIHSGNQGHEDWTQLGLKNIKARYEYLTSKDFLINNPEEDIIIENDTDHFIVKIPLIDA